MERTFGKRTYTGRGGGKRDNFPPSHLNPYSTMYSGFNVYGGTQCKKIPEGIHVYTYFRQKRERLDKE